MGIVSNIKTRLLAMRIGLSIIGEGIGFKSPERGGFLSAMASLLQPRWGEPPKRSSKQWIELYGRSPRLRPVYKIAKDVAAAEWGLYVYKNGQKKEITEHPMIDLLMKPNPKMSGYTLMFLTEVYLLLRGEGGWLIERNGLRTPAELWPIPPHWVTEIPSANNPFFTVQTPTGAVMKIDEKDMVWFIEPDPVNPYSRGLGSAEGISDEVETDEYMAKWAKRFFFNDAKPPVVIKAPGATKPDADRIIEQWMEKYAGYKNAHRPAVLNWDGDIIELGKGQKEMDFVESRKFLRDTANQHFFVPPELMGIIENSNRATIDAADYLYTKNVLKPCLDLIQEQIQIKLCPEFDEKLAFEFVNPIPEDKEFSLKVANEGLERGAITVDEWRQANDYDPLPGNNGSILYVPVSVIPTDVQQQEEQEHPIDSSPGEKSIKGLTPEQKTAMWWGFEKGARKQETAFKRAVKKFFQEQQDRINNRIEQLFGEKTVKLKDADNIIELLANWIEENEKLKKLLKILWVEGWKEAVDVVDTAFNFGISFDLLNQRFLDWVENYGAEQVKGINETTKQSLREEISQGIALGESVAKLRDRVSKVFTEAKGIRAETIARTESHNSVSAGTFETYRAANVGLKEWLATRDDRTRDSHLAIDGEVQPIDQPFSNGLMYPGAPGPAKEVINCRCALLPVV